MKTLIYSALFSLFVLLTNTGCVGTIYSATVDERNVKTIASDKVIENTILANLLKGESSDVLDVSVTSYEGRVFLVGEYETTEQKNRFISTAKKVDGVRSVGTYLVKLDKNHPCGTKANLTITAKVKAALVGDKSIWSTNINISTIKCQVVLWGTVGTSAEVSKAIAHAKSVEGVKSVKSFLKAKK